MKKIFSCLLYVAGVYGLISCNNDSRYLDLSTGKNVVLEKDSATGLMVNAETKVAPEIYVDTKKHDTIYGKTGEVINGHVIKNEDGKYVYDDGMKVKSGDDYKLKDDQTDIKIKEEKDGDVKIKGEESKTKIDGDTGKKKTKG